MCGHANNDKHECVHICMAVCMYMCVHVYRLMCVHVHVSMCVCVRVYCQRGGGQWRSIQHIYQGQTYRMGRANIAAQQSSSVVISALIGSSIIVLQFLRSPQAQPQIMNSLWRLAVDIALAPARRSLTWLSMNSESLKSYIDIEVRLFTLRLLAQIGQNEKKVL